MRRKIHLAVAAAAVAATVWSGCSRENDLPNMEVQYGKKDTVKIDVNFKLSGIESKSEVEVNDVLVEDVNVFVVDEVGSVIYKGYYTSTVEMEIEAYEDMLYSVYAIANAGEALDGKNVEEIEGLVYSIPDISYITSPAGAVLMSGKTGPQKLVASDEGRSVTVYLTRCIAKVKLKADYSQLNDDVEITVTKVQLKNAPACVNVFGESRITEKANSMDGEAVFRPSATDLGRGLVFYQFENLQGTLQPENNAQKQKQFSTGNPYSELCSYIELKATYSSPRKYGDILYRFYLGTDMIANYDIKRNTQMNITVSFINDGGVDENTWRVDNSNIVDCVSNISLSPTSLEFTELGETKGIAATVLPVTAPNKTLEWHTSDASVATVDEEGYVTSIGNGSCTVSASSTDGSNVTSNCSVTVNYQEPEPEYPPVFTRTPGEMYHGQREMISFENEITNTANLSASSSNPSVVKIAGITAEGIEVMALSPGEATICAGLNGTNTTECRISVVELKILPNNSSITMYNHFYEEIGYTISPAWAAADFTVEMKSSSDGVECGFDGLENRVIPQFGEGATLPASGEITLGLSGREDVQATVDFTVRPFFTMVESMQVNANLGNSDVIKSLELETHPRANVEFSWAAEDEVFYGDPGDWNVYVSAQENRVLFPIPNSANGLYRLTATVKGDDGYGENGTEGVRYCDITVYETVYLVGISKTVDRNRVSGQKDTWEYENEVVAAWLSHPNSLIYPQGEVDLELPYKFNGETYTDTRPGITETFQFTFEKGETLNMPLGTGSFTYNGTPPLYYISYFKLSPAGSAYVEGNKASGQPYIYVYSRSFMSGFSDNARPNWEKIFELVYPK